nr:unnamed protein product [Digitaria exilis]
MASHDFLSMSLGTPEGEIHVGEDGVGVDPPDPLGVRVGYHGGAHDGDLGPVARHGGVEEVAVVEELDPVEAAVVELVLEEAEEEVVAGVAVAGLRLRPGDHHHFLRRAAAEEAAGSEPRRALGVPAGEAAVAVDGHGVGEVRNVRGGSSGPGMGEATSRLLVLVSAGARTTDADEPRSTSTAAATPAANTSASRPRPAARNGGAAVA